MSIDTRPDGQRVMSVGVLVTLVVLGVTVGIPIVIAIGMAYDALVAGLP